MVDSHCSIQKGREEFKKVGGACVHSLSAQHKSQFDHLLTLLGLVTLLFSQAVMLYCPQARCVFAHAGVVMTAR